MYNPRATRSFLSSFDLLKRVTCFSTPGPSNPIPCPFLEPSARSWSHFVGKSYQNLQKWTFD